ncbi:MAG: NAD(P)/FAD-dependent oxidoreductase [Rhizobiaceae bacterium]|nr:NAD(P)/FAD-dependent oxidoreductase [Rhizobiaceae bacterium]
MTGQAADAGKSTASAAEVVIIGAGPVGLFAVFQLGLFDMRCHVVDILDRPGGQCAELYHDKPIYDIPGHPRIVAGDLVARLTQQIAPFAPTYAFGRQAVGLRRRDDGGFGMTLDDGAELSARAVVIAAGAGAFVPRQLSVPGAERFAGRSIHYHAVAPQSVRDSVVVVTGGGDAALGMALDLMPVARKVTLLHRSAGFRAAPALVGQVLAARDAGRLAVVRGEVTGLQGYGDRLSALRVRGEAGEADLACAHLFPCLGRVIEPGTVAGWGVGAKDGAIPASPESFETCQSGVYAIGDAASYPGKLPLILSGFHEAALMTQAVRKRLRPGARPGQSYTSSSTDVQRRLGVG